MNESPSGQEPIFPFHICTKDGKKLSREQLEALFARLREFQEEEYISHAASVQPDGIVKIPSSVMEACNPKNLIFCLHKPSGTFTVTYRTRDASGSYLGFDLDDDGLKLLKGLRLLFRKRD